MNCAVFLQRVLDARCILSCLMKLTTEERKSCRTRKGAIRKEQVYALGLKFPLPKGWLKGEFTETQIEAFRAVTKEMQERELSQY